LGKIKHCNRCRNRFWTSKLSWLPTIVIAILPKCPFCVMAYSGAVSLCSGKTLFPNAGASSIYIFSLLCLLVLLSIKLNHRDNRTRMALAVAGFGSMIVIASQYFLLDKSIFYFGAVVIILGTWINGSLYSILSKYINQFNYKNLEKKL